LEFAGIGPDMSNRMRIADQVHSIPLTEKNAIIETEIDAGKQQKRLHGNYRGALKWNV
jgi:hypothetical protein